MEEQPIFLAHPAEKVEDLGVVDKHNIKRLAFFSTLLLEMAKGEDHVDHRPAALGLCVDEVREQLQPIDEEPCQRCSGGIFLYICCSRCDRPWSRRSS